MKLKRNLFKKIVSGFLLATMFLPIIVLAQPTPPPDTAGTLENLRQFGEAAQYGPADENTIKKTIGQIVLIFLSFLGIILVLLIIYGGFLWMTAGGEANKVDKAKTLIKNAVIGVIIIVAAYIISWFVINALQQATINLGG